MKQQRKKKKVSEMVLDFAGDFIRLGDTLEKRENGLRAACTAWNIACAPEKARADLLDQFLVKYRKSNPGIDDEAVQSFRGDMEQLIQEKIKKYPAVNLQIMDCKLTVKEGLDHVAVASLDPGLELLAR